MIKCEYIEENVDINNNINNVDIIHSIETNVIPNVNDVVIVHGAVYITHQRYFYPERNKITLYVHLKDQHEQWEKAHAKRDTQAKRAANWEII